MKHLKLSTKWLVLLTIGLTVTACGAKEESETTDDEAAATGTVGGGGGGGGGAAAGNTAAFSIVGNWLSDHCNPPAVSDGNDEGPEISRLMFRFDADGSLEMSMAMFSEPGCEAPMMTMHVVGTYLVGLELQADPAVKELDIEAVSSDLTVHSQAMVDALNGAALTDAGAGAGDGDGAGAGAGGFCTKADPWVVDEPVDFADLECGGDMPVPGQKIYQAVSVVGDMLQMSDEGEPVEGQDGNTPATRKTSFSADETRGYVKQAAVN